MSSVEHLEEKKVASHYATESASTWDLADRFSSWEKLIRVTAYLFKFVNLCRRRLGDLDRVRSRTTVITADDCFTAKMFWIRHIQAVFFPELKLLASGHPVPSKSSLAALAPFVDAHGILRVGGTDNGTNFVGADRELQSAYRTALRDRSFQSKTASDKIAWHFIPSSAPHFGGIWEAGVRSVKHHLCRVVGSHTLTSEEFSTLLCQIEACLNSRPIAPLSDSIDDVRTLTPGHFLVGSNLITPPEPSVLHLKDNRLSRWQVVRHITERFWTI